MPCVGHYMTYTAKQLRDYYKSGSNNSQNNNKNICALRVAQALNVADKVRYLHTISDLCRAARHIYSVRSRLSAIGGKGTTVGSARKKLAKVSAQSDERIYGYIIRVAGHVILCSPEGETWVDTDPRLRDRRGITHCYALL